MFVFLLVLPFNLLQSTACTSDQPFVMSVNCPLHTLVSGEVVQMILKKTKQSVVPHGFDNSLELSQVYCSIPGCLSNPCENEGTCEEADTGFICKCLEWYSGDRCQSKSFIHSLRLIGGGSTNEGRIVITTHTQPTMDMLIHQENWSKNASRLVCNYLGYEDVYATVGGNFFEVSSLRSHSKEYFAYTMDPTNGWYEGTVSAITLDNSIGIICCTLRSCSVPSGSPVGLESGKIPDDAIIVSSEFSYLVNSSKLRLNGPSAWVPSNSDVNPWLQITFNSTFVITAVTTQGRSDAEQWMTSYTVSFSEGGTSWTYYKDIVTNSVKVFTGNYDQNSYVVHTFFTPIVCRYFRIHPKTKKDYVALRFELTGYGPINELLAGMNLGESGCSHPLRGSKMGVEDGRIPDSSLTASSSYSEEFYPPAGRLNGGVTSHNNAAWLAMNNDGDKWVKVSNN
ncbi:lactadherin-like [Lytechinus variegatus]|uniref:lactadherin-like n=1 Tax=Lytechinus variegatus TaxID=7654 RepID=UPI001BB21F07|nr:lactadherin-like [Lytechinus variegatus]